VDVVTVIKMFENILKGRCRMMIEEKEDYRSEGGRTAGREEQNCLDEDSQAAEKEKRAAEHFTTGVLSRGEAARPRDGKLPRGATHEIVEAKQGELPKVRRRRFSLV
jgi:hypothetical protein